MDGLTTGGGHYLTAQLLTRLSDGARLVKLLEAGRPEEAQPLRRLAWARLLRVVRSDNVADWPGELCQQRRNFQELVQQHASELDVKKFDANIANPLSRNTANPFLKIQANEELLNEIWKDVERTYAEIAMLTTAESRKAMQRVLFHWCRANNPAKDAAESYRQGMNELVAVIYYVVRCGEFAGQGGSGEELCGAEHSEADTFALFSALMELGVREMFAVEKGAVRKNVTKASPIGELPRTRAEAPAAPQNPQSALLARCGHIFDVLLRTCDAQVHRCLEQNSVPPQIFLLRWLRLLFCREFHLEDTLLLWDHLFIDAFAAPGYGPHEYSGSGPAVEVARGASASIPLVDFVAVAMVHYVRQNLLESDEQGCMERLLKFPPVEDVRTFCEIGVRFRRGDKREHPISAVGDRTASLEALDQPLQPSRPSRGPLGGNDAGAGTPPARATRDPLTGEFGGADVQGQDGARATTSIFGETTSKLLNVGRQALDAAGQRATAISQKLAANDAGGTVNSGGYPPPANEPSDRTTGPFARLPATVSAERKSSNSTATPDKESSSTLPVTCAAGPLGAATPAVADGLKQAIPSAAPAEIADLRQRLAASEAKCEHVRKKASEFFSIKNSEWDARAKELEHRASTAEARVRELEGAGAARKSGNSDGGELGAVDDADDATRQKVGALEAEVALQRRLREAADARSEQLQEELAEERKRCEAAHARVEQLEEQLAMREAPVDSGGAHGAGGSEPAAAASAAEVPAGGDASESDADGIEPEQQEPAPDGAVAS